MMLHQSTNPPQVLLSVPAAANTTASPLDVIRADICPIENDTGHELLDTLCYMRNDNDLVGMLDLYEAFAAHAERLMFAGDRADGRAATLLCEAGSQAWARAYLVADFLKEMRPVRYLVERHCQALFNAAIQMGATIQEASLVVAEIASWELEAPLPASMVR